MDTRNQKLDTHGGRLIIFSPIFGMGVQFAAWLVAALMLAPEAGMAQHSEHGVILQYHHIDDDTPPSTSTPPADFRRHMEYLRDNGFNVIRLDTMIENLRQQRPLPDKAVAITFDDGYTSIHETAFPLLQSFDFPFTLFVSTQPIDDQQNGFMSWDQIREMASAGAIIANHTVTHEYMLKRQNGESQSEWLARQSDEVMTAEARIQQETGQSHKYLAYPFGEFDVPIKRMLEEYGFVGIAQNSGAIGYYSDFLALPRYPLGGSYAELDSAQTKFDTLAFHVSLQEPESPVTDSASPSVRLKFEPGNYNQSQLGCYMNGRNIPMNWLDREAGLVELNPDHSVFGRRWRYICTARAKDANRYYWYSVQWINPGV